MAFHVTKTALADVAESGGKFISKSGIYDVVINYANVTVNEHNARSINFNIQYEGTESTLYGLRLDNNDGTENFGMRAFNNLCVIAGIESVSEPVTREHKVGKDGEIKEFAVLEDFDNLPVKVRVQFAYHVYQGEIKETKDIKAFYREDGASAFEILSGFEGKEVVIGTQLEKDMKYADNVTYNDGLTEETVEAWKKDKKTAAKDGTAKTAKPNPFAKGAAPAAKPNPFAKK